MVASTSRHVMRHDRQLFDTQGSSLCRGEEVCLAQGRCSSFSYEIDLAGKYFPYTVSYTSTAGQQSTSFIFMVCSNALSYGGCVNGTQGCSGLSSFKIRTKDELLEVGRGISAFPSGYEWASCAEHGPGHVWDGMDLGSLENSPAAGDSCQMFTITVLKDATLADLCEQNISIQDDMGNMIYSQPEGYASCFFVLEGSDGSSAYGSLRDTKSTMSSVSPSPTTYGSMRRKLRVQSYDMPGRLF